MDGMLPETRQERVMQWACYTALAIFALVTVVGVPIYLLTR